MKQPVIVGLTGGIGSGKSTVARVFEVLGVPVFYADQAGIAAYAFPHVREAVVDLLGLRAYRPDGQPDRAFIAEHVFAQPEKLQRLNAIIHPAVRQQFDTWRSAQKAEMIIREAAILFESDTHRDCDFTITVEANEDLRIARVVRRGAQSASEVRARIDRQWSRSQRVALADFILENEPNTAVIPQVLSIIAAMKRRRAAPAHKH